MGRLFSPSPKWTRPPPGATAGPVLGWPSAAASPRLMDGSLTAESEGVAGKGSTFRITARMPVADSRHGGLDAPKGSRPTSAVGTSSIVDDNATNRRILVAQTARWGMVPRETGSPDRGAPLARGARRNSTSALVDLQMPEIDGLELAARGRGAGAGSSVPIVRVLSSIGRPATGRARLWRRGSPSPSSRRPSTMPSPGSSPRRRGRDEHQRSRGRRPVGPRVRRCAIRCASSWPRTTR